MNRQWIGVFSLLLNMTSMMPLLSFGWGTSAHAFETTETTSTGVMAANTNITSTFSLALEAPTDLLLATSWRSAGRGIPGSRVGGAGR